MVSNHTISVSYNAFIESSLAMINFQLNITLLVRRTHHATHKGLWINRFILHTLKGELYGPFITFYDRFSQSRRFYDKIVNSLVVLVASPKLCYL